VSTKNYRESVPCPICGGPMTPRAKRCSGCYSAKSSRPKKPCPSCGKPIDVRSSLCRRCRFPVLKGHIKEVVGHPRMSEPDFDYRDIDPLWAAEFAGFFWGEGTVLLQKAYGRRGLPTPLISIHLREDERPVLEDIQSHLGGVIVPHKTGKPGRDGYVSKPQLYWNVAGHRKVEEVLRLLKSVTGLPARKRQDVDILLGYIEWRKTIPVFPSAEDKQVAQSFKKRLSAIKVFKVQG
jgi:hypothetical protein